MLFKWDKEQVDRQPVTYLMHTISINIDMLHDILGGVTKGLNNVPKRV